MVCMKSTLLHTGAGRRPVSAISLFGAFVKWAGVIFTILIS
jgi:hypothetical protein